MPLDAFLLDNVFWVLMAAASALGLGWSFRSGAGVSVSATMASLVVAREKGLFLDVRGEKEFAGGHIARARNIPASEVENKSQMLQKFKDKPVVVVCKNGMQSKTTLAQLEKQGFTKLHILSGGIVGWQDAQLPLTTK